MVKKVARALFLWGFCRLVPGPLRLFVRNSGMRWKSGAEIRAAGCSALDAGAQHSSHR